MGRKKDLVNTEAKAAGKGKRTFSKVLKVLLVLAAAEQAMKLYAAYRKRKAGKKEEGNEGSDYKIYEIFMSGRGIRIEDEKFAGAKIRSCIGGVSLDLSKARIEEDAFIHIRSICGGIDIKVPVGVNVRCDGKYMLFGGFSNSVPDYEGEGVHTIFVEANLICSGLCIRAEQKNDDIRDYFQESTFHNLSKEEFKEEL